MISPGPASGLLQSRLSMLGTLIYLGGAALGIRVAQLQVLEREQYALAAERNRSQMIYQTAPRGRLYDRKGTVLAANASAFSLIYIPGEGQEARELGILAAELGKHLGQDPGELLQRLQQAMRERSVIRLAENLPAPTMFRLSELKTLYPGIDLIVEARRSYPFGRFASHLIGFMGRMDPRHWRELKLQGYRIDSRIGRMGLEAVFEGQLRGRDGGIRMEVDAQGRLKRILERIPGKAGSNVHLTIDARVQRAADEGLRRSLTGRGAVVALDPRDGAILALSSAPDFDPNEFLSSDPAVARRSLAEIPEFNLAISGTYAPGSAYKPIVAAAALNEGRWSAADAVFCPGHLDIGARTFLCWEAKGHRNVSWPMGLVHSCDVFFYRMGLKTGGALIERYSRLFGLGEKTRIVLKGEKRGNVFGPQAKTGRGWYDGDTANLSIGQGELLVTPIQMAVVAATLANRGTIWRPHFTERIVYADGRPDYRHRAESSAVVRLKEPTWAALHEAMRLVVSSGTGRNARVSGLEVYGKTGTAQNPGKDHAWFVSFAARPGEAPSIAAAVLVAHGEHGSSAAAPIARELILAHFGLKDPLARPSAGDLVPAANPGAPALPMTLEAREGRP